MAVRLPAWSDDPAAGFSPDVLRRWTIGLAIAFLALYWGLALGLGNKGLAGTAFVIIATLTFLFPRTGAAFVVLAHAVLATFTYFLAVNQVPKIRGGEGFIGWDLPYEYYVMFGCLALLAVFWVGVLFRAQVAGERWQWSPLERALGGLMALGGAWGLFSLAQGIPAARILYDLHVLLYPGAAVALSRTLHSRTDWVGLLAVAVIGAVLHWFAMLGDLAFGGVFQDLIYLVDVLRLTIGASPDLAGPLVPVLLALGAAKAQPPRLGRSWLWWSVLLFTGRTIATLSRSAWGHLVLALGLLGVLMGPGGPRRWVTSTMIGIVVLVLGGATLVIAAKPQLWRLGRTAIMDRMADLGGGKEKQQEDWYYPSRAAQADGASDVYRLLETETALEQLEGEWLIGKGPGSVVRKRFRPVEEGADETYLHNGYLWYVYKFGIVGLLMVLACWWRLISAGLQGLKRTDLMPWQRALTQGYLAAVIPLLPFAATNNIIGAAPGLYVPVLAFAWMCYLERLPKAEGSQIASP